MSATDPTPAKKRPAYFLWTALLVGLMAATAVVNPTLLTGTIADVSKFFYLKFDWLIMWLPLLAFGVGLTVALSPRFGNIRLGGQDAVPEYSFLSWMNMLFTAGIGALSPYRHRPALFCRVYSGPFSQGNRQCSMRSLLCRPWHRYH